MKRPLFIVPLLAALAVVPVFANPVAPQSKHISPLALAGYEALNGEGVVVTLADQKRTPVKSSVMVLGLVHDFDVLFLVNELRGAGAQGISVGGVRLTNQSSIRCVGPSILVDGKRVKIPLRIEAVGKAAQLKSRLESRGGIVDSWKGTGPGIQIKTDFIQLEPASLPRLR